MLTVFKKQFAIKKGGGGYEKIGSRRYQKSYKQEILPHLLIVWADLWFGGSLLKGVHRKLMIVVIGLPKPPSP